SAEYQRMHDQIDGLSTKIAGLKARRRDKVSIAHQLKRELNELQHAKGRHWREKLFGKTPTEESLSERADFQHREQELLHAISA
ncbi:hypothetical protein ABTM78_21125, partial [Acinetobacter baumannii]